MTYNPVCDVRTLRDCLRIWVHNEQDIDPMHLDHELTHILSRLDRPPLHTFGPLVFYPDRHDVTVDGEFAELTNAQYEILFCLFCHQGETVTNERLWYVEQASVASRSEHYKEEPPDYNIVKVFMTHVRRKLGVYGDVHTGLIKTVWGKGYRLEME